MSYDLEAMESRRYDRGNCCIEHERRFVVKDEIPNADAVHEQVSYYFPHHHETPLTFSLVKDDCNNPREILIFGRSDFVPVYSLKVGVAPGGRYNDAVEKQHLRIFNDTNQLTVDDVVEARIRLFNHDKAFFTIKRKWADESGKHILEIPLKRDLAENIIKDLKLYPIRKDRHVIYDNGLKWEVDHYPDVRNPKTGEPLVIAELEGDPDKKITLPAWIDPANEVTGDSHYSNCALARSMALSSPACQVKGNGHAVISPAAASMAPDGVPVRP